MEISDITLYPLGATFQSQEGGYRTTNTFSLFSLPDFLLMFSADCQPSTGLPVIWFGERESAWLFFHLLSKLEVCSMSLSFFKLSIPNDFSIFISQGNRGWIGPESHQGLNAFRTSRRKGWDSLCVKVQIWEEWPLPWARSSPWPEHIPGF